MISGTNDPDLLTLVAVIARSQIILPADQADIRSLPAGFDEADLAILEWITTEGRRTGCASVRM